LAENVRLEEIAEECQTTLTGADFYALCADAFSLSMKEYITIMTAKPPTPSPTSASPSPSPSPSPAKKGPIKIVVEQRHFITAVQRLKPSVSAAELAYYKKLQDQFRNKKANT
jgi:peroxin-6